MNPSIYAFSTKLPGEAVHVLEDDGLWMRTYYVHPTLGSSVHGTFWKEKETAERSYAGYVDDFLSVVPTIIKNMEEIQASSGKSRRLRARRRVMGPLVLYGAWGGDFAFLPRLRLSALLKKEIHMAWLFGELRLKSAHLRG